MHRVIRYDDEHNRTRQKMATRKVEGSTKRISARKTSKRRIREVGNVSHPCCRRKKWRGGKRDELRRWDFLLTTHFSVSPTLRASNDTVSPLLLHTSRECLYPLSRNRRCSVALRLPYHSLGCLLLLWFACVLGVGCVVSLLFPVSTEAIMAEERRGGNRDRGGPDGPDGGT